eukprot:gb/GEZN01010698.1/.p1 GENE.gb/GEZN01010698.1/~~gb/GEZN01010698.1/.p1  ORF type:complete len:291 (-),score=57.11 gb/GEZN01010698.1/:188-1060(-)
MSDWDYVALQEPAYTISTPLRVAAGLVGLAVSCLVGAHSDLIMRMGAAKRKTKSATQQVQQSSEFFPKEGMEGILIKPGSPGGLQAVPLPLTAADGGPFCLFSYGPMLLEDGVRDDFLAGTTTKVDAWLYGVILEKGRLAFPTGSALDTVQGILLCWPPDIFQGKLKACDKFRGFDADQPEQSAMRRTVVSAVLKDGSTAHAYWYFRMDGKKKKEKPGFFAKSDVKTSSSSSQQSQFESFSATTLHCNTCGKAMPVEQEVLKAEDRPGVTTYEYRCTKCSTVVGRREVQN